MLESTRNTLREMVKQRIHYLESAIWYQQNMNNKTVSPGIEKQLQDLILIMDELNQMETI